MDTEPLIAVFVDFENLALGVRGKDRFDIERVLKRLLERGRIVAKRAYCDWSGYQKEMRSFHEHGVEMIDIPRSRVAGKNSADIRMVVDALDLCYSKSHIDVFALLTGDSDFSPLVSKLKENNKRVIGCGVRNSTSDLLINNCDEFLFYDELVEARKRRPRARGKKSGKKAGAKSEESEADTEDDKTAEAMERLVSVVEGLTGDYDPLWGSLVKQTIRRVYPGFSERYYGYGSFAELLEDAQERGLLALVHDDARGNYKVSLA